MTMPSIAMVSREWENQEEVRGHIRTTKFLLDWEDRDDRKVNIKNADRNYHVLKPLAKRLLDSDGGVGMFNLPQLTSQLLSYTDQTWFFCFFSFWFLDELTPVVP